MRQTQFLQRQRCRQGPRIPYFQSICKKHDLYAAIACIIAVRYGIDNRLGHNISGNFVQHRSLRSVLSGTYPKIDFGHHEIHGLIHQIKDCSFIHLV